MYSVSLVCVVMYWKIGQFYKDSETAGYKGIYYYIIFSIPDTTGEHPRSSCLRSYSHKKSPEKYSIIPDLVNMMNPSL